MLLCDLKLGQSAKIVSITDDSIANGDYLHHLHSMGIITGCDIMLMRYSPLNDLVLLKISGSFVAISSSQASCIAVEPIK